MSVAQSETHKEVKERDTRSVLHASVNPDTLPFTYVKGTQILTFVVENTGDATQIFKIKTTASWLYRIRPVHFKLPMQERQEVTITYKGSDAGPIPMCGKDRISVVFAHALDAKKPAIELWELHRPYANLSYAESREYVRVLFVDSNGKLVVTTDNKSRSGMDQRSQSGAPRSITMRLDAPAPLPPQATPPPQGRRTSAEKEERSGADEKSNADAEQETPSQVVTPPPRSATPRTGTPKAAGGARTPSRQHRSPSPNSKQDQLQQRKSPAGQKARSRDPIESILSSATKDASALVFVQYGKNGRMVRADDDGSTYEDEDSKVNDEDTKRKEEDTQKKTNEIKRKEEDTRKRDEDTRREEQLKKKVEETRRREEVARREEEARKKREEEDDDKGRDGKKRTSNEEVKQDSKEDNYSRPEPPRPRRRKLGPDGKYIDDDSAYLDEQIRREQLSVRLLMKGQTGHQQQNQPREEGSYEDDKPPPQPRSEEY